MRTTCSIAPQRLYGRAWVDKASGRVMKTELEMRNRVRKFAYRITTTCDSYPGYLDMKGVATYGRFRSFQVRTQESVQP